MRVAAPLSGLLAPKRRRAGYRLPPQINKRSLKTVRAYHKEKRGRSLTLDKQQKGEDKEKRGRSLTLDKQQKGEDKER